MDDPVSHAAELAGHLAVLCADSAQVQDIPELRHWLADIAETLRRTRVRLEAASTSVSVAFVGLTNVGKSTLINALFGVELAPRKNGPCTPIAIEYRYGDDFTMRVLPTDGGEVLPFHTPGEILATLSEKLPTIRWFAPDLPPRIKIGAPLELLKSGMTLIDTPGFGAAQTDDGPSHDLALKAFLVRSRASVVWVVNGQQGITAAEKRFHDQHLADLCDHVAVTSCEDWEQRDRERFTKRFGEAMGRRGLSFHFVSGVEGLRAKQKGDQALLARSGVPAIERCLLDATDRVGLASHAISLVHNLLTGLYESLEEFRPQRPLWREDSFYRWHALCSVEKVKEAVEKCMQFRRAP
jgi:GTP-binding protein EngB required for normal cell division